MSIGSKIHHECTRKMWHENTKTALEHAARLNEEEPDKIFGIYVCLFCNGLHVGHMKPPRNKWIPDDYQEEDGNTTGESTTQDSSGQL